MGALPLTGRPPVQAARWPAAALAGELLAALGGRAQAVDLGRPALRSGSSSVAVQVSSAAQDWAQSGAMFLTGYADGEPLHASGRPATLARAAGLALGLLTDGAIDVDGAGLLSERAASLGLHRRGRTSANGSCRLLLASDGWFALSLPRPDDQALVPALIQGAVDEPVWPAIERWAQRCTVDSVVDRAGLLGLAVGKVAEPIAEPAPWQLTPLSNLGESYPSAPTVLNLGSLWAAPLCAHLLAGNGAQVIDVETPARPDGARLGTPRFYDLLHGGNARAVLELSEPSGRQQLRALVRDADVIITGSRGHALERLGLTSDRFDSDRPRVWVHITGHGTASARPGFGDDAAVAGGLLAWTADGPVFAGDAIADPLTGLLAALATTACLQAGGSWQIEVSLRDVAAYSRRHGGTSGAVLARPPRTDRY